MNFDRKELDQEIAKDDCAIAFCPDVAIIRQWPREKRCKCGFQGVPTRTDGKNGYHLSCPKCGSIVNLKEIENE